LIDGTAVEEFFILVK